MTTIEKLRNLLSQVRQKRHYIEKDIERMPAMLPACMILRYRQPSARAFESSKDVKRRKDVKSYAYLTFLDGGKNRHRYVPKEKIGEVARLTEAYKMYGQKMQQIRQLNRRVLEILDEIAKLQTQEVSDYVYTTKEKSTCRTLRKGCTRQSNKRREKRR